MRDSNKLVNEILFIVTYRCNLRCEYCFSKLDWFDRKDEIDIIGYKKIFSEIKKTGFPSRISISGGEPFMREDIEDIISLFLESTNSQILINTNGLLVKEHFSYITNMKKEFKERLLFAVSLDGPKEVMENLHKNCNIFDDVIQITKLLKGEGIKVGANLVCLKPNKGYIIGDFLKLIKEEFDYISLFRFLPMGLGALNKDKFWINEMEVNDIIKNMKEIDGNGIKYGKLRLDRFCAVKDRVTIDPQGFVKVCIATFWEEILKSPFYNLKTEKLVKKWADAVKDAHEKFSKISQKCPAKPTSCGVFNWLLQS